VLGTLLLTAQARGPQPVECTNCSDETGLIVAVGGALLAFVALLVSFWSLYLTALRRPKIELDQVAHDIQLRFPAWSGELPAWGVDVDLRIVLANTGASGTFVVTLELADSFTCHGSGACLFARLEKDPNHLRGGSGAYIPPPPISFERGENEPYSLVSRLHLAPEVKTGGDIADRLRELEAVSVTVEWSYRRGKLLRQRKRETKREHATVRLSADRLKFEAASHWRSYPDYHRYADALEGRSEDAQGDAKPGGGGSGS
jgi:hypothetical protein